MSPRYLLVLLTALVAVTAAWLWPRPDLVPVPAIQVAYVDPLAAAVLDDYRLYRDASLANDVAAATDIARSHAGFLGLRASFDLARNPTLPIEERLEHLERALGRRIEDPLARGENRELMLELAGLAETAGRLEEALGAYEEALPLPAARAGLERLQTNPYRLSNSYFGARLYQDALDTLGSLTAPSIEAPAYRALGDDEKALDAYERWLLEQPDNLDARFGEAWAHFRLGNLETARRLFLQLPGSSALYGRALIANREGAVDEAVALLQRSGSATHVWLATGILEANDRHAEAVPIYLDLAGRDTRYADDAAYRALVLARRMGLGDEAVRASSLVPEDSFFGLKLGADLSPPTLSTLPNVRPNVIDLAAALANAGDLEAAVGELTFALRDADDEATAIAIGEVLQFYGEYRQSQRAAARFVSRGSTDLRTWRLAYPRAYPKPVLLEAGRRDLAPELVWAVMRQESAFYPLAVSSANAQGLMQVIPSTWDWLAELQNESPGDPFDPVANIRYGSTYLEWLIDFFDGDLELVVASYNRGQGYIRRLFEGPVVQGDKDELYREIDAFETREYLQRVMVNFEVYKALYR